MALDRTDYAYPFRIDPTSRQAARATYNDHIDQMIRQVLLTSPGERVDLPDFGCGVRQMVFAPWSDALQASSRILVQQSLERWLGNVITLQRIDVKSGDQEGQVVIYIEYTIIDNQTQQQVSVRLV